MLCVGKYRFRNPALDLVILKLESLIPKPGISDFHVFTPVLSWKRCLRVLDGLGGLVLVFQLQWKP